MHTCIYTWIHIYRLREPGGYVHTKDAYQKILTYTHIYMCRLRETGARAKDQRSKKVRVCVYFHTETHTHTHMQMRYGPRRMVHISIWYRHVYISTSTRRWPKEQKRVCVYIYTYICIYKIYIYSHKHIHIYSHTHIHANVRMHVYSHTHTHMRMHVCMYLATCRRFLSSRTNSLIYPTITDQYTFIRQLVFRMPKATTHGQAMIVKSCAFEKNSIWPQKKHMHVQK
jgi:hypothetical protein